jgi:hypothetical protein
MIIVELCKRELTGVGPSIAKKIQLLKGNKEDLVKIIRIILIWNKLKRLKRKIKL